MQLVDSHCHLDYKPLSEDLKVTLGRAEDAEVGAVLTIGTTIEGSRRLVPWIEPFENIWCRPPYTVYPDDIGVMNPRPVGLLNTSNLNPHCSLLSLP